MPTFSLWMCQNLALSPLSESKAPSAPLTCMGRPNLLERSLRCKCNQPARGSRAFKAMLERVVAVASLRRTTSSFANLRHRAWYSSSRASASEDLPTCPQLLILTVKYLKTSSQPLGFCVCVLCTLCFSRFMQSVFAIHFLPLYHSIYFF